MDKMQRTGTCNICVHYKQANMINWPINVSGEGTNASISCWS